MLEVTHSRSEPDDGEGLGLQRQLAEAKAEITRLQEKDRANARLRAMADAAPILLWETDRDGVTFVNQHYLDFFGASFDQIRAMGWSDFLHPEDLNGYVGAYLDGFTTRRPYTYECRFRRADGEYRWMRNTGAPVGEDRFAGGTVDITDLLEAQAALKESEERLILEGVRDHAILTTDTAGTITSWSAGAQAAFGWSTEEALGQAGDVLFSLEDRAAGVPNRELTIAERHGTASDERWHLTKDGRRVFMSGSVHPLPRDAQGRERGFIKIARDETERRQADAALRRSEELARTNGERVQLALAAGAIIGTWFWDLPSDRFTVDEGFASSFGLDPTLGREGIPLAQIVATVHPDDQAGLAAAITSAILRGGAYAHQYRVRRADGRYYWIEANGRVDHAADGTPLSFPGVLLDIESRHAAEEALRTAEERLQLALTASGVVGLWDWMVDTDLLHGDANFARLYGLNDGRTAAGITMEQYQEFVVPEDIAPLRAAIADTFERAVPFLVEYRLAIPGEALRWVECKGQLIHDAAGTPVRFSGTAVDITDRKTAEARLATSEKHWRGLFERLSEGFIVGEVIRDGAGAVRDWRYVDVNRAWGELVSIDPVQAVGRTIREVFPGIEDAWVHEFADVVETGQPVVFTRRVSTLRRWYEGRAFPLGAEQFGVIFLEVTARVEADVRRDALLELGERLRDLDTVPALVEAAAGILARATDATRAGYGLVDPARETVEVLTDWRAPGSASVSGLHSFRVYGSYIQDLKHGEVVAIDDVALDPRTRDTATTLLGIGVRVLLNVPILERGRLVGIAFVHWADYHPFTADDLAFVRTVADRVQSAVARLQAEADQRVLNEEISHRLKNTFAMVISIASQTLRSVPERAPVEAFVRRIHALSSAHDVLLRQSWASASAREVMRAVLANAGHDDRVDLTGPELDLGPRATLSLSLLLHELATNAAKYGALSVPGGRVALEWRMEGEGEGREVSLDWTEEGGPPPMPPTSGGRKGFGSRLINLGLVGTGGVDLRYPPSGFQATMRAPLVQLQHS